MTRGRLVTVVGLVLAVAAGILMLRPAPEPSAAVPASDRQMPDFNPPIESDRPDLWEEPRVKPEQEPG